MTRRPDEGFSLIEVLVAVVILSIGTLMLAGGSVFVTRDLVRSRQSTAAASMAQAKLDELRARAASVSGCGSSQFTSSTSTVTYSGVSMRWIVPTSGANRTVQVITSYSLGRGRTKADTLAVNIAC